MSKTPKKSSKNATDAINALLRSRYEFLAYDIDFKIENDRIVVMGLEKEKISIYISSIDEKFISAKNMRITIGTDLLAAQRKFNRSKGNNKSAFIGWFKGSDIFVAWDPRHILSLSPSPGSGSSISARLKLRHDTTEHHPSIQKVNPRKITGHAFVIAMHSSMLTFYFKNMERLHSMNSEEEIISAMKYGAKDIYNSSQSSNRDLSETRPSYWVEIGKRDPKFRKSVLKAYNNACCICRKKLGIVEAAHIIPFACDSDNNSVRNGLALCAEHHILYDKAILMPDHNYKLVFNKMRAKELRKAGLGAGLREVEKFAGKRIMCPERKEDWPNKKNLLKGIEKRDPRVIPRS